MATGEPFGVVVVDADGELGRVNYDALSLPPTLTAITGRPDGGRHHYSMLPKGISVGNSTGKLGEGIDVRGTGGYVVLPGSVHPSGAVYKLDESGSTNPAKAPPELLALLTRPDRKLQPASFTATPPTVGPRELACGKKVLREECAKFTALVPGQGLRNTGLNLLALRVAECVAAGWLDEAPAWEAVGEAAANYLREKPPPKARCARAGKRVFGSPECL